MGDVQDCLKIELTQADAADCQTCLTEAMRESGTSTGRQGLSCQDVNAAWCPALSSQCQCGTCLSEVRTYAECAVDEATRACELDCAAPSSPSPTRSPSESPKSGGLAMVSSGGVGFGVAGILAGTFAWM
jgi:hypothetical protein